jgi:hypothetical protein
MKLNFAPWRGASLQAPRWWQYQAIREKETAVMRYLLCLMAMLGVTLPGQAEGKARARSMSPKEIAEGWIQLFDGETVFGWKIDGEAVVKDGVLVLGGTKATKASPTTPFRNFQLVVESNGTAQLVMEGRKGQSSLGLTSQDSVLNLTAKAVAGGGDTIGSEFKVGKDGVRIDEARYEFDAATQPTLRFEVAAGNQLALRSVKLKPTGLESIFNGKDLTGWKIIPGHKSKFTVTDKGELNIKDGNGDIQTEREWDDFVLQLEVYSNGDHLNSGVFFRCLPDEFWSGYEAQIRNQWQGNDRTKPVDYGTGGIYNRQPARKVVSSDREWFTMTVVANGKHMAVWVNGYQVSDYTDNQPMNKSARKGCKVDKGPISLQGHDPTTDLSFRNIRIGDLKAVLPR